MEYKSKDSFNTKQTLKVGSKSYSYFSLPAFASAIGKDISSLPYSLKVLLENSLRNEDGDNVKKQDIELFTKWLDTRKSEDEVAFFPARVLMQDFTGVPAVVDLAVMRDAMKKNGGDSLKINPLIPVDLVIDHSVQVLKYGSSSSFEENVETEMKLNQERYEFLRWGKGFKNFRVVPPGTGICHQVNLEYLSQVVFRNEQSGEVLVYPDSLVGTDSHTTMVNGIAVLGWGVGGIEAEAAMLGQPLPMLIPEVIGFKLIGQLKEGITATDLVLTVTNMLRKKGVVNKFVEFFGPGLDHLPLADRATIANMAPEYGATCGFFPIDKEAINYLKLSNRDAELIALVEEYAKAQGLWRDANSKDPVFTDVLELDISTVEPSLAGPKRPQDRVALVNIPKSFEDFLPTLPPSEKNKAGSFPVTGQHYELHNGDVVIAAITSCTNTSNPSVMIAAGLLAKNAIEKGLTSKPWVKTSLAPGSQIVTEYLKLGGLDQYLDKLGFNLVGYGCTTCIGNSGPLKKEIEDTISTNDAVVASVLSGNRNFEGRVHPLVKANYLASPPLVVAYALAGSVKLSLADSAIGQDINGNNIYLRDIWPSNADIQNYMTKHLTPKIFAEKYKDVFTGSKQWQAIPYKESETYDWKDSSTYIKRPPYFDELSPDTQNPFPIKDAKILAVFGDSITTDHISPAGNISKNSPAAKYLLENKVPVEDFNSYGARRGNHEVMMRGTFANIRIKNELLGGEEGGNTLYFPSKEKMSIYDAAMKYKASSTPSVIFAGKEYGTGSSRDWAAKGTMLLGVKAVIAESFERIHRSNLVGMGVIPFLFEPGVTRKELNLKGDEIISIEALNGEITPHMKVNCTIKYADGSARAIILLTRIDTAREVEYIKHSGILPYVVKIL